MTPTLRRPSVTLRAAGATLDAGVAQTLSEVRVAQRLSLPSQCELVFTDPGDDHDPAAALAPGTPLEVVVGGFAEPLFEGEVTGIEFAYGPAGAREVRVRGYDLLHRLGKRFGARAHVDTTPRSLAAELVRDLGVTVAAVEAGPRRRSLIQGDRSDLELLRDVAEGSGLFPTLRGRTLHLTTLAGLGDPRPLALGETLFEARFDVSAEPARSAVTAWAWDPRSNEVFRSRAEATREPKGSPGRVAPRAVGGDGEQVRVGNVVQGAAEVAALARAALDRQSAREVSFWGVAEGDPELRPATRVEVRGVHASMAGRFVLMSVVHVLDARGGFVSELSTVPPARSEPRREPVAMLGIVTRVDDPDGVGRVRVSLPTCGDVETDWLQVLSAGAGAGKGLMILPDRGDRVLVLATDGDPGRGIVLGGLYGQGGWPDAGVEDAAVRRFTLRTAGGQWIRLDDGANGLVVGDATGSRLELTPQRVLLHAAADLHVEAPGRAIVIRGAAIDFERG